MVHELSPGIVYGLCTLATWRLTHLVVAEDGPGEVIVRLRGWAGDGVVGQLMDCFYCASLWLAAPFAFVVADDGLTWLLSWLAISGAASLLEQATNREINQNRPARFPDEEE